MRAGLTPLVGPGVIVRLDDSSRKARTGENPNLYLIHDDDLSYMKNGEDVPIFTATRSSVREAGRLTAEMLLGLIAHPEDTPQQRLLEAELIIGQSTGPVLKA